MTPKRTEDELKAFFDALAESVASAHPEDVLEEVAATEDVEVLAEGLRALLLARVTQFRKERLRQARGAYDAEQAQGGRLLSRLPETPDLRRRLLERVFAKSPVFRNALLTVQHRDFTNLDDGDITLMLQQLESLGALDDVGEA